MVAQDPEVAGAGHGLGRGLKHHVLVGGRVVDNAGKKAVDVVVIKGDSYRKHEAKQDRKGRPDEQDEP